MTVRISAHNIERMDISSLINSAEKRAKDCGLSVAVLCAEAGINRATWQRWKAGITEPRLSMLDKLESTLSRYERKQPERECAPTATATEEHRQQPGRRVQRRRTQIDQRIANRRESDGELQ
ncbi:helix-turn-helix transcriptional regulator [Telmatospirillum sp.]|uniref:helix-turn-helix domain-containing protein n=1 Tax=Telmatospirillum sp. TaxID=2079197 RepID=UPI0028512A38|nr:helix-turn-helix transcriptional regulator [Telmatospirillum sp.]MDR3439859.1 helix-turn-helix transcriptional regulator [Telmatospirillum sp.]